MIIITQNNKRKILLYIILIFFTISLFSCEIGDDKIVIFVKGSQSMSYVFEKIADAYVNSVRDEEVNLPQVMYGIKPNQKNEILIPEFDRSMVQFIFMEGNSSSGIASLLDGNKHGEIILSSRDLETRRNEIRIIENINVKYIGDVLYVFKYGEDYILPITNKQNPRSSFYFEEMKDILRGGTKYWGTLKPYMEDYEFKTEDGLRIDTRMQITLREKESTINYILRMETTSIITDDILEISSDMKILKYVSELYNSLSFISSVYKDLFDDINIKELKIKTDSIDYYKIKRNCNIMFMKNQNIPKVLEKINNKRKNNNKKILTMDDIFLDFINFANTKKRNLNETDKGKDIAEKYIIFDF